MHELSLVLIPVAVPVVIALVKYFLPSLPKVWLPILAPILGAAIDICATFSVGTSTLLGAALGSAGVGLREIKDQVGKAMAMAALVFGLAFTLTGCAHKLESGGAYAPVVVTTNADGATVTNTVVQPDYAFYVADATFDLAYSAVDAAFKFERDNRALLWKTSPEIKKALDKIRPQAAAIVQEYGRARAAYLLNPTGANLSTLETIIAKLKQITAAATAAIPAAK